ncbi:MAG TPA: hypothetical protein VF575_03685 [Candidatus Saccharimonadales bacterium]|jgi:hypothetical protein
MASIRIKGKTSVSPEQFIASLTDFGPNREKVWGNSQSRFMVVHDRGTTWTEVTEGSNFLGGMWERVHYNWSEPNTIVLRTITSNVWNDKSGWQYQLNEAPDGSGTMIEYTITRFAKNRKGRCILILMRIIGKPLLTRNFRQTLRAIEKSVTY